MTSQFEIILLVDELTAEQEDLIYDEQDALISSHGDASRLTVTVEGSTALAGARRLLRFLRVVGARPRQFCEDFVTRADIADRADVSRQAVGLWGRGERHQAFPTPYSPVAGGIWLFWEVDSWLRKNVWTYDGPELSFPTREDHVALADLLLQTGGRTASRGNFWGGLEIDVAATGAAPNPPVDRHAHGWSTVARVRHVDLRLAA